MREREREGDRGTKSQKYIGTHIIVWFDQNKWNGQAINQYTMKKNRRTKRTIIEKRLDFLCLFADECSVVYAHFRIVRNVWYSIVVWSTSEHVLNCALRMLCMEWLSGKEEMRMEVVVVEWAVIHKKVDLRTLAISNSTTFYLYTQFIIYILVLDKNVSKQRWIRRKNRNAKGNYAREHLLKLTCNWLLN